MQIRGQFRWGLATSLLSLWLVACASAPESPRTAQDALDQARRDQWSAAQCQDLSSETARMSSAQGRVESENCHSEVLILQRSTAAPTDHARQSPGGGLQRVPETLNLPPLPVPVPSVGGGVGILR